MIYVKINFRCLFLVWVLLVSVAAAGCASVQSGENELNAGVAAHKKGDLLGAFSVLSSLATSPVIENEIRKGAAKQYLLDNIEIGKAGLDSITAERLWKDSLVVGDTAAREVMVNDLSALEVLYGRSELASGISDKRKLIEKSYYFVEQVNFDRLSEDQKFTLASNYLLNVVAAKELGRIEAVEKLEVVHERGGHDTMEAVHSSILYMDNRRIMGGYSPEVLFATIILTRLFEISPPGGFVGSYIRTRYGVRLMSGEFKYAEVRSYSKQTHSVGACVYMKNMMLINGDACK